jgi:hypothetical protein
MVQHKRLGRRRRLQPVGEGEIVVAQDGEGQGEVLRLLGEVLRTRVFTRDDADEMLVALRESGRFEALREDLRLRKALDHVAQEVQRIPLAQAEAREAIWTPDKENPPTETKLWTPDQQQSEGARS